MGKSSLLNGLMGKKVRARERESLQYLVPAFQHGHSHAVHIGIASFPGPAQLSVVRARGEPGNEATLAQCVKM